MPWRCGWEWSTGVGISATLVSGACSRAIDKSRLCSARGGVAAMINFPESSHMGCLRIWSRPRSRKASQPFAATPLARRRPCPDGRHCRDNLADAAVSLMYSRRPIHFHALVSCEKTRAASLRASGLDDRTRRFLSCTGLSMPRVHASSKARHHTKGQRASM